LLPSSASVKQGDDELITKESAKSRMTRGDDEVRPLPTMDDSEKSATSELPPIKEVKNIEGATPDATQNATIRPEKASHESDVTNEPIYKRKEYITY
jgi:hypothetical protein